MSDDEIKLVHRFVVDRKTWLRGEGTVKSRLLRPSDGKMCCIGSYALACGFSRNDIDDVESLEGVAPLDDYEGSNPVLHERILQLNERLTKAVYDINDDEYISDEVREAKLTEELAKLFITVEFVD